MNKTLAHQLQQWFTSTQGQAIWRCEQEKIEPLLTQTFGYLALQLGLPQFDFLANSPIQKKLIVSSFGEESHLSAHPCIEAQAEEIPLQEQSVDLLILPHSMELNEYPSAILREAHRLLINEGRLIILGFNPLHLWNVRSLYHKNNTVPIPLKHQISQRKLSNWVKLAGFEIEHFTSWGESNNRWLFLHKNPWLAKEGAFYVISARKRSIGLRLVGPALTKRKKNSQQVPVLTSTTLTTKHNK